MIVKYVASFPNSVFKPSFFITSETTRWRSVWFMVRFGLNIILMPNEGQQSCALCQLRVNFSFLVSNVAFPQIHNTHVMYGCSKHLITNPPTFHFAMIHIICRLPQLQQNPSLKTTTAQRQDHSSWWNVGSCQSQFGSKIHLRLFESIHGYAHCTPARSDSPSYSSYYWNMQWTLFYLWSSKLWIDNMDNNTSLSIRIPSNIITRFRGP